VSVVGNGTCTPKKSWGEKAHSESGWFHGPDVTNRRRLKLLGTMVGGGCRCGVKDVGCSVQINRGLIQKGTRADGCFCPNEVPVRMKGTWISGKT